MKKQELADLAVRLFNNIDQAEQFNVTELFYHCDNKYLLEIIESLAESVKRNAAEKGKMFSMRGENISVDDEELEEIFTLVGKTLKGSAGK